MLQEARTVLSHQTLSHDPSHPWVTLSHTISALGLYLEEDKAGFREALTSAIMRGGRATVSGAVAGAVLGLVTGFQNLPKVWVENVSDGVRRNLDKKLNNLFDLMGIP